MVMEYDMTTLPWNTDWMRAEKIGAMRTSNSPFPDGYDIHGEERALTEANLLGIDDDVSPVHPLYTRLNEYDLRRSALDSAVAHHGARQGADPLVSDQEASKLRQIGRLEADGDDALLLHTRDAYRLFMGRGRSPDGRGGFPIVGGRKAAAALLALWNLSSRNNPYADWLLIQFMEQAEALRKKLRDGSNALADRLQEQANRGFVIKVAVSTQPQSLHLGFRSPYGYEIAFIIADFDWATRHIRTLAMKALLSTNAEAQLIRDLRQEARRIFAAVVRGQRILLNERLVTLSRNDWLSSDASAKARVAGAQELLGELPPDVFQQKRVPKHHRQHALSAEERRVLESVDLEQLGRVEDGPADPVALESAAEQLL